MNDVRILPHANDLARGCLNDLEDHSRVHSRRARVTSDSTPVSKADGKSLEHDPTPGSGEVIISKRQNRRIVAFNQNKSRRDEPG